MVITSIVSGPNLQKWEYFFLQRRLTFRTIVGSASFSVSWAIINSTSQRFAEALHQHHSKWPQNEQSISHAENSWPWRWCSSGNMQQTLLGSFAVTQKLLPHYCADFILSPFCSSFFAFWKDFWHANAPGDGLYGLTTRMHIPVCVDVTLQFYLYFPSWTIVFVQPLRITTLPETIHSLKYHTSEIRNQFWVYVEKTNCCQLCLSTMNAPTCTLLHLKTPCDAPVKSLI